MAEAFIAKITEKGEIPVPEDLRKELGLSPLQEVRLLRQGNDLVVRSMTSDARLQEQMQVQERVNVILRRAKVRAAALAEQVTVDEAWALYDRAAEALGQAS
jgi:bifunctional DNA-binding transcriptional regulator/antitoxin component of YhaV-PrlF toxin-antitoxin module